MENQKRPEQPTMAARKSPKRKLEEEFVEDRDEFCVAEQDLVREVVVQVEILNACRTSIEADHTSAKRAIHVVSEYAKIEEYVNLIVKTGVVTVLVKHLEAPPQD